MTDHERNLDPGVCGRCSNEAGAVMNATCPLTPADELAIIGDRLTRPRPDMANKPVGRDLVREGVTYDEARDHEKR